MERLRELRPRLAAGVVGLTLLAAGCVGDEQTTASFGPATTRPDILTTSAAPPASTTSSTSDADDASTSTAPESTSTTEPLLPLQTLAVELVAEGFDQPILVTGAPGTDALFVVEREGVIKVVEKGSVRAEPFLDLRDQLTSASIEQGLLGLAFHPSYAESGRFVAYWTMPDGDSRLAAFTATDPTTADPGSLEPLLDVDQPAERHNAGMVAFGPDGLLYLALGDGGGGGSTGQDTSNLLGSILRVDLDRGSPYAIPADNPFGDEIWVYGLRNPWRFSIDPVDELVYIGDVGQDDFEEVNVVGLDGAGTNFGWFAMEGDQCFRAGCDPTGLTTPILQYDHGDGCSVTGGAVYRGAAIPELHGHYFFADWCSGFVRSLRYADDTVTDQIDWTGDLGELGQITSFGVDNNGELHVVTFGGAIYRIVPVR